MKAEKEAKKPYKIFLSEKEGILEIKCAPTTTCKELLHLIATQKKGIPLPPEVYSFMEAGSNKRIPNDVALGKQYKLKLQPPLSEVNNIFGSTLEEICAKTNKMVPELLTKCGKFIEETALESQGIFRLSGEVNLVNEYLYKFNTGVNVELPRSLDPSVAAGVIKQFLRQLPDPLLKYELYDAWIKIAEIDDDSQRLHLIRNMARQLPETNYNTLKYLMFLMHQVCQHTEENKMSPQNLAIVVGPNILRSTNDMMSLTMDSPAICRIITIMIENYFDIFGKSEPVFARSNATQPQRSSNRSYFENPEIVLPPLPNGEERMNRSGDVKITGESIVVFYRDIPDKVSTPSSQNTTANFSDKKVSSSLKNVDLQIEKEIPFECIDNVELSLEYGDQVHITYHYPQSKPQRLIIRDFNAMKLETELLRTINRYKMFLRLSQQFPQDYGNVPSNGMKVTLPNENRTQRTENTPSPKIEASSSNSVGDNRSPQQPKAGFVHNIMASFQNDDDRSESGTDDDWDNVDKNKEIIKPKSPESGPRFSPLSVEGTQDNEGYQQQIVELTERLSSEMALRQKLEIGRAHV